MTAERHRQPVEKTGLRPRPEVAGCELEQPQYLQDASPGRTGVHGGILNANKKMMRRDQGGKQAAGYKGLQSDDIIWRAFEDIAWVLGIR